MIAIALAFAAGVTRPAPALAATPCWKQLLNDWYDGRIDKTYPVPCYTQAINHLPTDVEVYSSARDDIQRALASAIAGRKPGSPGRGGGPTASGGGGNPPGSNTSTTGRKSRNGPFGEAIDRINPGSADSLPLPLLVLGALALMLVLAGVAGVILRRRQAGPSSA